MSWRSNVQRILWDLSSRPLSTPSHPLHPYSHLHLSHSACKLWSSTAAYCNCQMHTTESEHTAQQGRNARHPPLSLAVLKVKRRSCCTKNKSFLDRFARLWNMMNRQRVCWCRPFYHLCSNDRVLALIYAYLCCLHGRRRFFGSRWVGVWTVGGRSCMAPEYCLAP